MRLGRLLMDVGALVLLPLPLGVQVLLLRLGQVVRVHRGEVGVGHVGEVQGGRAIGVCGGQGLRDFAADVPAGDDVPLVAELGHHPGDDAGHRRRRHPVRGQGLGERKSR